MEKPPVLSDRKIVIHLENGAMIDVPLYSDLEAQRDKDVEWFCEEIEKVENPYDSDVQGYHWVGWQVAHKKILSLFRPIKNPVGSADL